MSLFARTKAQFSAQPLPWWRSMSLIGWGMVFLATVATTGFVLGLAFGETLFLPSYTSKSGPAAVSYASSPVLFILAMGFNLVASTIVWGLFIRWLLSRRRIPTEAWDPIEFVGNARGTRYDPKSRSRTSSSGAERTDA